MIAGDFFQSLFIPPPVPDLPWPAAIRLASPVKEKFAEAFSAAFHLAYFEGCKDGFIAGTALGVAFMVTFVCVPIAVALIGRHRIAALIAALLGLSVPANAADVRTGPTHDGVDATIDLPAEFRLHNVQSKIDKLGMCVWATMDMAALYQNIEPLTDIMERLAATEKGGGWPERVDQVVRKYGGGVEVVQYQGADPAILDLAMRTGRPCGITLGTSDFYRGETISHDVLLVHLDAKYGAIIDNNDEKVCTWMERDTLLQRARHPTGIMWAWVLLGPPPPPVPTRTKWAGKPLGNTTTLISSEAAMLPMLALTLAGQLAPCTGPDCATTPIYQPAVVEQPFYVEPPRVRLSPPAPAKLKPAPEWDGIADAGKPIVSRNGWYIDTHSGKTVIWKILDDGKIHWRFRRGDEPLPASDVTNFGLYTNAVFSLPRGEKERYTFSGPHAETFAAQAKEGVPELTDDSRTPHITILSPSADERKNARSRIEHLCGDKAHVQAYSPDNPLVRDLKFWGGSPQIIVQEADRSDGFGRVVTRLPIDATAEKVLAALRKADPAYSPAEDTLLPDDGVLGPVVGIACVVAGCVLFVMLARKPR